VTYTWLLLPVLEYVKLEESPQFTVTFVTVPNNGMATVVEGTVVVNDNVIDSVLAEAVIADSPDTAATRMATTARTDLRPTVDPVLTASPTRQSQDRDTRECPTGWRGLGLMSVPGPMT
jgi:hypothetical protein